MKDAIQGIEFLGVPAWVAIAIVGILVSGSNVINDTDIIQILQDEIDLSGRVKKKVLLVSNGRTAEGRVYSGGLQHLFRLCPGIFHQELF